MRSSDGMQVHRRNEWLILIKRRGLPLGVGVQQGYGTDHGQVGVLLSSV